MDMQNIKNDGSEFKAQTASEVMSGLYGEIQQTIEDNTEASKNPADATQISYKDYDFTDNNYKYDLAQEFQLSPDALVVVGNEIIYFGGELTDEEVSISGNTLTGLKFSSIANRAVPIPIKAIKEGRRVIAFSLDSAQAKEYIQKHKKEIAA